MVLIVFRFFIALILVLYGFSTLVFEMVGYVVLWILRYFSYLNYALFLYPCLCSLVILVNVLHSL